MIIDYLLRQDRYWRNVLDVTESRIVENRLKEEGIRIHYHSELAEIALSKSRGRSSNRGWTADRMHLVAIAMGSI
jgi:hypothetical protein